MNEIIVKIVDGIPQTVDSIPPDNIVIVRDYDTETQDQLEDLHEDEDGTPYYKYVFN